ncbi:uncharacterized protein MYCFIDRAFT_177567 [Pseudocercospora fijiensis CIRAD86]|uniref:F-box domain-containing protein n=1 Tax=Pseudocercospora fijiensis (strain CIRAD86) TaxID=383855 RepID=M2YSD6_PSEFD|nr:uncharacterized protein MYCFIDRAFT_177567 [Pseudocercospora fijiensis CIRAD86]EME80635.1 hypothetical protein MYCFIDRAFT_177567 [Pseudocercospora fijiensis CIRAD86]
MPPSLWKKLRAKLAIKRTTAITTTSPPSPPPTPPPSPVHKALHVPTNASKTFAIPELLEQILLNLPTHDLLKSLRVNKTFSSTILASPLLQASLFLLPSLPSTSSPWPGHTKRNTLLEARTSTWTSPRTGKIYTLAIRYRRDVQRYVYSYSVTITGSMEYWNDFDAPRRTPPALVRASDGNGETAAVFVVELRDVPGKRKFYGRKVRGKGSWPSLPPVYEKMRFFFPARGFEVSGETRKGGTFRLGVDGSESLGEVLVRIEGDGMGVGGFGERAISLNGKCMSIGNLADSALLSLVEAYATKLKTGRVSTDYQDGSVAKWDFSPLFLRQSIEALRNSVVDDGNGLGLLLGLERK